MCGWTRYPELCTDALKALVDGASRRLVSAALWEGFLGLLEGSVAGGAGGRKEWGASGPPTTHLSSEQASKLLDLLHATLTQIRMASGSLFTVFDADTKRFARVVLHLLRVLLQVTAPQCKSGEQRPSQSENLPLQQQQRLWIARGFEPWLRTIPGSLAGAPWPALASANESAAIFIGAFADATLLMSPGGIALRCAWNIYARELAPHAADHVRTRAGIRV